MTQNYENYIDRIYDTYIDEDKLQICIKNIEIADNLEPRATPQENLLMK